MVVTTHRKGETCGSATAGSASRSWFLQCNRLLEATNYSHHTQVRLPPWHLPSQAEMNQTEMKPGCYWSRECREHVRVSFWLCVESEYWADCLDSWKIQTYLEALEQSWMNHQSSEFLKGSLKSEHMVSKVLNRLLQTLTEARRNTSWQRNRPHIRRRSLMCCFSPQFRNRRARRLHLHKTCSKLRA